jgi:hypothetical protein
MDRDKFFAELDQLTASQIEARLPLWDDGQLDLVKDYLDARSSSAQTARRQSTVQDREAIAIAAATRALKIATVAIIIAIGAMLAAIASALVAIEALHQSHGPA